MNEKELLLEMNSKLHKLEDIVLKNINGGNFNRTILNQKEAMTILGVKYQTLLRRIREDDSSSIEEVS